MNDADYFALLFVKESKNKTLENSNNSDYRISWWFWYELTYIANFKQKKFSFL